MGVMWMRRRLIVVCSAALALLYHREGFWVWDNGTEAWFCRFRNNSHWNNYILMSIDNRIDITINNCVLTALWNAGTWLATIGSPNVERLLRNESEMVCEYWLSGLWTSNRIYKYSRHKQQWLKDRSQLNKLDNEPWECSDHAQYKTKRDFKRPKIQ